MINRALALLILIFGLVGPVVAAELDEGVAAARSGDYVTALRGLSPLAESGDARAQFDIGFMHAYGWGVPRNPAEALIWYRKAADQGLPVAQHFLGLAYANGEGVRPDRAEAARWFGRSAAQGFAQSQYMLGLSMLNGSSQEDRVQGYAWLVLAGQAGVRAAGRVIPKLTLTETQRAQAQGVIAQFRPKPESASADVASPRPEDLLGLDHHFGEILDASTWPASAIGVVTVAHFGTSGRCTGTLVAPKIVLTAAHCLANGAEPASPAEVHFLAAMSKGTPASSSAAAQLIVAKDFVPTPKTKWTAARSPDDWALIILKEALPVQPVAVKALAREQLQAATLAGTISGIGYGEERRYSPTALRNCRADWTQDRRVLAVQCLANFGYSGSPILVNVEGTPVVVGIVSTMLDESGLTFAPSASQFEAAIREQIAAEGGPSR
jgi:TPR repeat protein